jgi:hypothetical protein
MELLTTSHQHLQQLRIDLTLTAWLWHALAAARHAWTHWDLLLTASNHTGPHSRRRRHSAAHHWMLLHLRLHGRTLLLSRHTHALLRKLLPDLHSLKPLRCLLCAARHRTPTPRTIDHVIRAYTAALTLSTA